MTLMWKANRKSFLTMFSMSIDSAYLIITSLNLGKNNSGKWGVILDGKVLRMILVKEMNQQETKRNCIAVTI